MPKHAVLIDINLMYSGVGDRFYLKYLATVGP